MSAESATRSAVRFRAIGFMPRTVPVIGLLAFALVIGLWEIGSRTGFIPAIALPAPSEVGLALWKLAKSGELLAHIKASLFRLLFGWIIGTAAGLALGIAIGTYTLARSAGLPLVMALFPIPKIALLPLFIIWFGIGEPSKVATIAFGVFFPTVVNTFGGVDGVPRNLIRMSQAFGVSPWRIMREVVLPGALPQILSGFRISTSIGIILLVSAEMIAADKGVGALVLNAGNLYQTDQLIAGVVVLSVFGLTVSALLGRLERRLLAWR